MLAALLANIQEPEQSRGGGGARRRINPERKQFDIDWDIKSEAQDELTKFNSLSKKDQEPIIKEAISVVRNATESFHELRLAREAIEQLDTISDIKKQVEQLNIVILSYNMLLLRRKNRNIAAMLMLGVL